ncbi:hypothetical protein OAO87_04705 [bacterium]|nr:hypothetical protein [bacterium]
MSCTDARFVSHELSRLPVVECETVSSGGEQGLQRRTLNLLLVSITVLATVSLWLIGVAGLLAEPRCVKREVSRPMAADGHGHGSCDGQLLDAEMGPQRRLRGPATIIINGATRTARQPASPRPQLNVTILSGLSPVYRPFRMFRMFRTYRSLSPGSLVSHLTPRSAVTWRMAHKHGA